MNPPDYLHGTDQAADNRRIKIAFTRTDMLVQGISSTVVLCFSMNNPYDLSCFEEISYKQQIISSGEVPVQFVNLNVSDIHT